MASSFMARAGRSPPTNRHDEQEAAALTLHLLQASLVYVNTLMLQQILAEPGWFECMTPEDFRALSPLIYHHINPYGTFELDLAKRLPLVAASSRKAKADHESMR
jgi:hypothetical protein